MIPAIWPASRLPALLLISVRMLKATSTIAMRQVIWSGLLQEQLDRRLLAAVPVLIHPGAPQDLVTLQQLPTSAQITSSFALMAQQRVHKLPACLLTTATT